MVDSALPDHAPAAPRVADLSILDALRHGFRRVRAEPGRAVWLFALPRPHAIWLPGDGAGGAASALDPTPVVIGGVAGRTEIFDPRRLAERIPVDTLHLPRERLAELRGSLRLEADELGFLERLERPAPIPMVLWKRGLDPHRAGALLVGLNLVGAFAGQWESGLLPRLAAAVGVLRRQRSGAGDRALLGVGPEAGPVEVERAFRRLSLELHPDRVQHLPPPEAALATEAFQAASAARARLRRSRRARPVQRAAPVARVEIRRAPAPASWAALRDEARRALERGQRARAAAFALKALALSPPETARAELADIVSSGRAA